MLMTIGLHNKIPLTEWYIAYLTDWGRVTHIYASKVSIGPDKWLVALSAPSHYLNQCWNVVNSTLRHKLQWNVYRNSNIFIEDNALENVVCKMASIFLGLNVLTMNFRTTPPWYMYYSHQYRDCDFVERETGFLQPYQHFGVLFRLDLLFLVLRSAPKIYSKAGHDIIPVFLVPIL